MKKIFILILGLIILSGCAIAKISGRGVKPIILNMPEQKVRVIEHIEFSEMITFDYTNSFDVSEVLKDKLAKSDADAVVNTTITVTRTFGGFLLNLITLFLANATTMEVTADLVKYEKK